MKHLTTAIILTLVLIVVANAFIWEFNYYFSKSYQFEMPEIRLVLDEVNIKPSKTGYYVISHYSEIDSCHYPIEKGCLTASSKIAEVGMVASNLFLFGTKIEIDGLTYTVEDRTNTEYSHRIDIFTGYGQRAYEQAKELGIRNKLVIVK